MGTAKYQIVKRRLGKHTPNQVGGELPPPADGMPLDACARKLSKAERVAIHISKASLLQRHKNGIDSESTTIPIALTRSQARMSLSVVTSPKANRSGRAHSGHTPCVDRPETS